MIDKKNLKIYGIILILTVAFITCILTLAISGGLGNVRDGYVLNDQQYKAWSNYEEFEQVKNIIDDQYYLSANDDELYEAAIKGMVASLNDPYSVYYSPEEYQQRLNDLSNSYSGLGMVVASNPDTGKLVVSSVMNDSPAKDAGIKPGDILLMADDTALDGTKIEVAVSLMKGDPGTHVELTIERDGKVIKKDIIREEITIEYVKYEMLDGKIGYISISQFGEGCSDSFDAAISDLKSKGAVGLIIDIRNNPGGYFNEAISICDSLLDEKRIVSTKDKDGKEQAWDSDASYVELPYAVIVNEYSASASEIVAGAVKDSRLAKVVGATTYGKGVVQTIISLNNGGGLKLTTAEYFSPNGSKINGEGVWPDIAVDLDEAQKKDMSTLTRENDHQLNAAISLFDDVRVDAEPTSTPAE